MEKTCFPEGLVAEIPPQHGLLLLKGLSRGAGCTNQTLQLPPVLSRLSHERGSGAFPKDPFRVLHGANCDTESHIPVRVLQSAQHVEAHKRFHLGTSLVVQ